MIRYRQLGIDLTVTKKEKIMINRYWLECVTEITTYEDHKIYRDNNSNKIIVRFRWGDDLGEDINKFSTLKVARKFITNVVIPEWSQHLAMENIPYS